MVLILDGKLETGAHVWSNICYLICLRHLIRSREHSQIGFFSAKTPIFLHACTTCSELSFNISTMVRILSRVHYLCYRFSLFIKALPTDLCYNRQIHTRVFTCVGAPHTLCMETCLDGGRRRGYLV